MEDFDDIKILLMRNHFLIKSMRSVNYKQMYQITLQDINIGTAQHKTD